MAAIISNFSYSNGDEIITRQLPTRLMEWLGRLTGFEVEVVESPEARGTTLVARRINVGNAGSDAVVEMPLINNSFSDVRRFVNSATDVLSTDHGDQMLSPEVIIESCPDASVSIDLESLSRERMTEVKNNRSWLNKFQYREKKDEAHAAMPAEECVFDECGDSVIEPSVPTEIDLEEEECLLVNDSVIIHCFPCHIKSYEGGYSEEEVKEVFCVPVTYFKNTPAKAYEVAWNPVFPDDFPFDKIYGGRNYGWRPQRTRIRFYEYQGRVIWGMTARIIEGYVKEFGKDTGL